METMHIYRVYGENNNFLESGSYYIYFLLAYWTLNLLTGWNFSISSSIAAILLIFIGGISFFIGYLYIYHKGVAKADYKINYFTKDEFLFYVKQGKKSFLFLFITVFITSIILVISIVYFLIMRTILSLMLIAFLFFLIGLLLRTIPIRRFKLHFSKSYLEKVAKKVHERLIS